MTLFEFEKEFVICTAFGMFVALDLFGIWYTVSSVAGWLKKKVCGYISDREK